MTDEKAEARHAALAVDPDYLAFCGIVETLKTVAAGKDDQDCHDLAFHLAKVRDIYGRMILRDKGLL